MIVAAKAAVSVALARGAVIAALSLASFTAYAADAPLFAAPAPGHASGPAGSGSVSQVTIALAVVLAFVFVAAWVLRHLRKLNLSGNAQQLQIVAQVTLGAKERAVLIRVNETQVLVGVAPGQVTALHTFTMPVQASEQSEHGQNPLKAEASQAVGAIPSFQTLLKKSLGLS
jgi:flagellar protein FliO/FliZ